MNTPFQSFLFYRPVNPVTLDAGELVTVCVLGSSVRKVRGEVRDVK